tara:strand:+ start:2390 stop:3226 length:837 start_codon:yes stop_codon:yes gene_type:complete
MKKYLLNFFKDEYKFLFKTLNYSKKSKFIIESLNLKIKSNSHIGKKNEKLVLPLDEIITPRIFTEAKWDFYIIEFIKKNIRPEDNYFIDVGANIGLISKQLQNLKLNIKKYFCFEPESISFEILKKNLSNNNTQFFNFGLGIIDRKTKIFISNSNKSDNSIYFNKFKNRSSHVSLKNSNKIITQIIKKYKIKNIIYKSDTQGMDEEIFLNLNQNILDKIYLLVIEISNFDFLNKNQDLFLKKLQMFKKIFIDNGSKVSVNDIKYLIKKQKEFNILAKK